MKRLNFKRVYKKQVYTTYLNHLISLKVAAKKRLNRSEKLFTTQDGPSAFRTKNFHKQCIQGSETFFTRHSIEISAIY